MMDSLDAWMNIGKTMSVISATKNGRVWKDMVANGNALFSLAEGSHLQNQNRLVTASIKYQLII